MDQNKSLTPDFKLAELKLALLKENFEFQEFYEKLKNDPYTVCPELRKPEENDYDKYRHRIALLDATGNQFFGGYAKEFSHLGLYNKFFPMVQESVKISTNDILSLLNPQKDVSDVSSLELIKMLPFLFYSSGVTQYNFGLARKEVVDKDGNRYWQYTTPINLYPWERLIKIDLRAKKSQLVHEFKMILDKNYKLQKAAKKVESRLRKEGADYTLETAYEWKPDNSRERSEAWKQLKIWNLRKQLGIKDIAIKMKMSKESAMKSFYKAYERTQGKKYDKNLWKKIITKAYEHKILDPKKRYDKKTWDKLLKLNETTMTEKQIGEEVINGEPIDPVVNWKSENAKETIELWELVESIAMTCQKCQVVDCRENMLEGLNSHNYENLTACPKIYKLLDESRKSRNLF